MWYFPKVIHIIGEGFEPNWKKIRTTIYRKAFSDKQNSFCFGESWRLLMPNMEEKRIGTSKP